MAEARSEFQNESGGFVGVTFIEEGKRRGGSVPPGESVWLTEEEQIATANAPRRDEDNPFTNGFLKLVTPATQIANRRPIGDPGDAAQPEPSEGAQAEAAEQAQEAAERRRVAEEQKKAEEERRLAKAREQATSPGRPTEETGAAVSPQGTPEVGKRAPQEEVGTPEAPAQAG